MDPHAFDRLVRGFSRTASRRRALGGLLGGALSVAAAPVAAHHRHTHKPNGAACTQGGQCQSGQCCGATRRKPGRCRACCETASCDNQVCVGGQCVDCTSYSQCGATGAGHIACVAGRCWGGNTCATSNDCVAPLSCFGTYTSPHLETFCMFPNECAQDSDCASNRVCVLGICTSECGVGLPDCSSLFPERTCQSGACLP